MFLRQRNAKKRFFFRLSQTVFNRAFDVQLNLMKYKVFQELAFTPHLVKICVELQQATNTFSESLDVQQKENHKGDDNESWNVDQNLCKILKN